MSTDIFDEIQVAAYFNWINEGCPEASELSDWYRAEAQILHSLELERVQSAEAEKAKEFPSTPVVPLTREIIRQQEEAHGKPH